MNVRGEGGLTLLMAAAKDNTNPEVVSVLIKAGTKASVKDDSGQTAFYYSKYNPAIKGTKVYWELNESR